jgi:hypothetical protein
MGPGNAPQRPYPSPEGLDSPPAFANNAPYQRERPPAGWRGFPDRQGWNRRW